MIVEFALGAVSLGALTAFWALLQLKRGEEGTSEPGAGDEICPSCGLRGSCGHWDSLDRISSGCLEAREGGHRDFPSSP